jgi:hypothetical protein
LTKFMYNIFMYGFGWFMELLSIDNWSVRCNGW